MYMVIYREHGKLNMETQYIGPFMTWADADDYLCNLPALGICPQGENAGVKYVETLMTTKQHDDYRNKIESGWTHATTLNLMNT